MSSERPEDLTPSQTDAVRRALRAARHEAPLPDDVAARLDTTLAGLVAGRAAEYGEESSPGASGSPEPIAPVVPLRRRRWPAVLAAAAAVTAIGLAGTQLIDRDADHSHPAADSAAESQQAPSALAVSPGDPATDSLDTLGGSIGLTRAERARLAAAGYTGVSAVGVPADQYCGSCYGAAASTLSQPDRDALQKSLQSDKAPSAAVAPGPWDCHATLPPTLGATPVHPALHDGKPVLVALLRDSEGPIARAWPCDGSPPATIRLD